MKKPVEYDAVVPVKLAEPTATCERMGKTVPVEDVGNGRVVCRRDDCQFRALCTTVDQVQGQLEFFGLRLGRRIIQPALN